MPWYDPEILAPGGGLAVLLATLGGLKKAGKFPFNNNGNGSLAHKAQHAAIAEKQKSCNATFKALEETRIKQDMILESHEKRLAEGKADFKDIKSTIGTINSNVAVLLDRSEQRRSTD